MLIVYIRVVADHVTYGALAVASRRHILDALRASPTPLDVRALAETTGLHVNTVRFHLGVLIDSGYAASRGGRPSGPGRPQTLYTATTPSVDEGGYQLLAEVLAEHLDQLGAGELAQRAGLGWVRRANTAGTAGVTSPVAEATGRAVALFTELGFDPLPAEEGAGARIQLRACPFIDVARRHPDVVCGVHRGLLQGTTEISGASVLATELVPFAQPGICVARIFPAVPEERP
jgi:predicted ArsR family transcriptional regulator